MKLLSSSSSFFLLNAVVAKSAFAFTVVHQVPSLTQSSSKSLVSTQLDARKGNEEGKDPSVAAKKAALDGVLQKIERSYGRGSIVKLGDADNMRIESISTGALTLGELFDGFCFAFSSSYFLNFWCRNKIDWKSKYIYFPRFCGLINIVITLFSQRYYIANYMLVLL